MTTIARCRWVMMFTLGLGPTAFAQETTKRSDDDLFLIQGQVQKPEVVVVIPRENLDKGFVLELKDSFLHRIIDAVSRPPF